jgi:hypothetical protein
MLPLPPLTRNCESQTTKKLCNPNKKANQKKKTREPNKMFPLSPPLKQKMTHKSPKENPKSQIAVKSCTKIKPKGNW